MGESKMITRTARESERHLVDCCLKGDLSAFHILMDENQRMVYAVLSRILPIREDVDDLAQEAFLKAYHALPQFRGDSAFGTWVCRIAIRMAIRRSKSLAKNATFSLDDSNRMDTSLIRSQDPGPYEQIQAKERDLAVRKAVMRLPEYHRLVLGLHYFEGMSCPQIAELIGCSVGTVWSRLHYGCSKLKEELSWLSD